jgi:hypothetical protein
VRLVLAGQAIRPPSPTAWSGPTTARTSDEAEGYSGGVFLFFSNRLGCAGSLLVSLAVTVVLVALLRAL